VCTPLSACGTVDRAAWIGEGGRAGGPPPPPPSQIRRLASLHIRLTGIFRQPARQSSEDWRGRGHEEDTAPSPVSGLTDVEFLMLMRNATSMGWLPKGCAQAQAHKDPTEG
jgi:hypothetical protein